MNQCNVAVCVCVLIEVLGLIIFFVCVIKRKGSYEYINNNCMKNACLIVNSLSRLMNRFFFIGIVFSASLYTRERERKKMLNHYKKQISHGKENRFDINRR